MDNNYNQLSSQQLINESLQSELKRLLVRLEEAEKDKTEFLANIRNQLNNPLNSIIVLSENLMGMLADPEEFRIADLIHLESLNLDFVLKNLIVASEFAAGETDMEISMFNVRDLINEGLSVFSNKIKEKQLRVDVRCPEFLKLSTDRFKLSLAIHNLISNAIEFNKYNGLISITVEQDENSVIISVKDEGSGFSEEEANLIFMPFKQLKSRSSRAYISTGIGLSLVKNIVEVLEGKVDFISSVGEGSAFIVSIPDKIDKSDEYVFRQDGIIFDTPVIDNAEF
jgi:signal transduction histidine kinase